MRFVIIYIVTKEVSVQAISGKIHKKVRFLPDGSALTLCGIFRYDIDNDFQLKKSKENGRGV
jgi:hypothetical protein